MSKEWKANILKDFPFMKSLRWGFECNSGWEKLIRECCEKIVARYAKEGFKMEEIDWRLVQLKEKLSMLRIYYCFPDVPCGIAALDSLSTGESIRIEPLKEEENEAKRKLRHDIWEIIRETEIKSKNICEMCGAEDSEPCNDTAYGINRVQTLCATCRIERIRRFYRKNENI